VSARLVCSNLTTTSPVDSCLINLMLLLYLSLYLITCMEHEDKEG